MGDHFDGPEGASTRVSAPSARVILYLAGLSLAGGYCFLSFGLSATTPSGQLGAGYFPRFLSLGILACLAIVGIRHVVSTRGLASNPWPSPTEATSGSWPDKNLYGLVALCLAYYIMAYIGTMVIATTLFVAATVSLLNGRPSRGGVILGVLVSAAVLLGFDLGLGVTLPSVF